MRGLHKLHKTLLLDKLIKLSRAIEKVKMETDVRSSNLEAKIKEHNYLEIYQIKVLNECPILGDVKFTNKYRGIIAVASFIYAVRDITQKRGYGEAIPFFEKKGIKDLNEYLVLIKSWRDKGARKHYKALKEMLFRF